MVHSCTMPIPVRGTISVLSKSVGGFEKVFRSGRSGPDLQQTCIWVAVVATLPEHVLKRAYT